MSTSTISLYICIFFLAVAYASTPQPILLGPASTLSPINPPASSDILSQKLDETAQFAVKNINDQQTGKIKKNYELNRVQIENTRISEGTYYEIGVQFGNRPETFQFQFVDGNREPDFAWNQNSLPSDNTATSLLLASEVSYPKFKDMSLQGPMEIAFPRPRDDIRFRLPHLVEVDRMRTLRVNTEVTMKASGVTSIRLVDPVEVELKSAKDGQGLSVWLKQLPRVEIDGKSLSFSTEQNAKMKKIGNMRYELRNTSSNTDPRPFFMELAPNSPFMPYIEHMLQYSRGILTSSPSWNVKTIREGRADAVTLMLIPMELKELGTGINSVWNVIVSQDAHGNKRLISSELQKTLSEITVSPSVMANTTMTEVIQQLSSVEKNNAVGLSIN